VRALEEKILKEGEVCPGEILKVGSFLNQQIDTKLMDEMGKEIARLFRGRQRHKNPHNRIFRNCRGICGGTRDGRAHAFREET